MKTEYNNDGQIEKYPDKRGLGFNPGALKLNITEYDWWVEVKP